MGIDATQLRMLVVRPALEAIGLWSRAAENLVMGTAAQESNLRYIHQVKGPAVGLFQIEPATYRSIWVDYLPKFPELAAKLRKLAGVADDVPDVNLMAGNLYFAAAMCRVFYRRLPVPLPLEDDVEGLAAYWKKYYNTTAGRGTTAQYIKNSSLVA